MRWIDADQFDRALAILHQRFVRYVSFFGGEPLLHPRLTEMIQMAVARGMGAAIIDLRQIAASWKEGSAAQRRNPRIVPAPGCTLHICEPARQQVPH